MTEVEFVQSMRVLTLRPGDVLVVKVDRELRASEVGDIKRAIQSSLLGPLRGMIPVIVLTPGTDLGVLRAEMGG